MHRDPLFSAPATSRSKRAPARALKARRRAPRASFPHPHDPRVDEVGRLLSVSAGLLAARVAPRLAVAVVRTFDEARAAITPELADRLRRSVTSFLAAFYDEAPHATRTPFA